jgi:hypothetical protein
MITNLHTAQKLCSRTDVHMPSDPRHPLSFSISSQSDLLENYTSYARKLVTA